MQSFHDYSLPVDSISLSNPTKESLYLDLSLEVFPLGQDRFNRTGIFSLGFVLSNQTYQPPGDFGPFYFIGDMYENYMNDAGKSETTYSDGINYSSAPFLNFTFLLSFSKPCSVQ